MIDWNDFPEPQKLYTRNGKGQWKVLWYRPAICLMDVNTNEPCYFAIQDRYTEEQFEEIFPGTILYVKPPDKKKLGRQSLLPRFVHHFWAWMNGYSWLPCPICGRYFGGHEWSKLGLKIIDGREWSICLDPDCTKEAQKRNAELERRWDSLILRASGKTEITEKPMDERR